MYETQTKDNFVRSGRSMKKNATANKLWKNCVKKTPNKHTENLNRQLTSVRENNVQYRVKETKKVYVICPLENNLPIN